MRRTPGSLIEYQRHSNYVNYNQSAVRKYHNKVKVETSNQESSVRVWSSILAEEAQTKTIPLSMSPWQFRCRSKCQKGTSEGEIADRDLHALVYQGQM